MLDQTRLNNPLALAVLALLFERPMHPYEMASTLKQRRKEKSIKLRYGSLYTVIDQLAARGFIAPKQVGRDGRRPERTVYALTGAGRAELRDWMRDLLGRPVKEYLQVEAGLCLMPVLPPDEAMDLLEERLVRLDTMIRHLAGELAALGGEFPPLFVIESEYQLALLKTEERFIEHLIEQIGGDWGPRDLWQGLHDDRETALARMERITAAAIERVAKRLPQPRV